MMCIKCELLHIFVMLIICFSGNKVKSQILQNDDPVGGSLRLPVSLEPVHYIVRLRPYLEGNFTIDGSLELHFKAVNATNRIVLHMSDIETHNKTTVVKTKFESASIPIRSQMYDVKRQFYIIDLGKANLERGTHYVLYLEFTGVLSSDLEGFYKTSYVNSNKEKRWVAATQFQATNARRAFPCFDEPQLKATFDVYLGRREEMTAISNMPLEMSIPIQDESGWVYDKFQSTVPMSTYLLAFVICDFGSVTAEDAHLTTELKLWSQHDIISEIEFGKNVAAKGLVYLENFFNLSFPLPKLDIVAVPEMSPNAMENWGLIITRESGLLHALDKGSVTHMNWVAYLVSHELAHQWFGNIVTMKWWTDLWLNEGFATYIGYSVVDHIFPKWKILDQFVVKTLQKALKVDSLSTAPSVRMPVEDPQQIREVFGDIAYKKGASIIRMMQYFLGENTFRRGLSKYLQEMKYKSSEQDDLWHYLTQVAHEDKALPNDVSVKDIMDTWTTQSGFPVVSVVERNDHALTLTQNVFKVKSPIVGEKSEKTWYIPITWMTQENPSQVSQTLWMRKEDKMKTFSIQDNIPLNNWVLINPHQTAYCRVNYDSKTWSQLIEQLLTDHSAIPVISRAQLIDDVLNLAKIGSIDYKTAMNLLSYLGKETDYVPWAAALENIFYLDRMLRVTSHYGAFKDYLLSIISPMYERLGIENRASDSIPDIFLRNEIVMWACHLGHVDCIAAAINFTSIWIQNPELPSPAPGNLASSFYCAAVRVSDEHTWQFIWDRYQESSDTDLRKSLSVGLGCSKQVWILQRYLEAAFKPDWGIKRQDASSIYSIVAGNEIGSLLAWNHMKENWIQVRDYIGTSMFALPAVVKTTTSGFSSNQFREEMNWFMEKYDGQLGPAKWAIKQALETTEANIAWGNMNLVSIESWLWSKGFSSKLEH